MRTTKAFNSAPPLRVSTQPSLHQDEQANEGQMGLVITLPENPTTNRTLDLTDWLDRGIDKWVWAVALHLRALLTSKEIEASTMTSLWYAGMRSFFEFIQAHGPRQPDQLTPANIQSFIHWLSLKSVAYGTQKQCYFKTKSVLSALIRRGVIPASEGLFPPNPYPNVKSHAKGESPFSLGERTRLAQALRDDIIAIHRGEFKGSTSQALVVYILGIAIRCGANPTPLLEAKRDCLQPHPFLPNMRRLILFKRRGRAIKIANLRFCREDDAGASVTMDGVALVNKALDLSAPCVARAKPEHRNRLWLFEPENVSIANRKVRVISQATLQAGISSLVDRHNLRGDDGQPLKVNLSRLRKTVEGRLFDLSGGDLIATAALMGHTPQVADNHYLACTQSMREDATFVGEALPAIHRSGQAGSLMLPTPAMPGPTPAGRCKDPWQGDKAPKDGEPCSEFLRCFECRSYAITGDPDDLHRLFQTYNFLALEMAHAQSDDWRAQYRNTMNLIDRFALDKFGPETVAQAKARAKEQPSKFWASYTLPLGLGHA